MSSKAAIMFSLVSCLATFTLQSTQSSGGNLHVYTLGTKQIALKKKPPHGGFFELKT